MAAKRYLLAIFWAGVFGVPAVFGQSGTPGPMFGGGFMTPSSPTGTGVFPAQAAGSGVFPAPPPSSAGTGVVSTAPPSGAGAGAASNGLFPGQAGGVQGLPPGSVASPWYGSSFGPGGRSGPVVYETYLQTGPNLIVGQRDFSGPLQTGWTVAGGGRSLFMNQTGDAAWVVDLGIGYTYNAGDNETLLQVLPTPKFVGQQTTVDQTRAGSATVTPTTNTFTPIPVTVQRLMRTSFNYAIGRDWWLNGPGYPGAEPGWNSRFGLEVGGRWGTAHIEEIPATGDIPYLRRHGVFESVVLGVHWNAEVPIGACILFGGVRAQWAYTFSNLIPPLDGNLQDINILLTAGIRF